jgi:GNAT superfamily N-acetyltransferase
MNGKNMIFEKIESNEVFTILQNNVSKFSELTGYVLSRSFSEDAVSIVGKNGKLYKKQHPSISLELPNHGNSMIRIAPNGNNSLEINRIAVNESFQGKRIGSLLMNTLFMFCIESLGYIPPMFLECTGDINFENRTLINPIQNQTKFFRKFGFRVTVSKYYPNYVRMDHLQDKFLTGDELSLPFDIAA